MAAITWEKYWELVKEIGSEAANKFLKERKMVIDTTNQSGGAKAHVYKDVTVQDINDAQARVRQRIERLKVMMKEIGQQDAQKVAALLAMADGLQLQESRVMKLIAELGYAAVLDVLQILADQRITKGMDGNHKPLISPFWGAPMVRFSDDDFALAVHLKSQERAARKQHPNDDRTTAGLRAMFGSAIK